LTFSNDGTGPTGGTLSYTNGEESTTTDTITMPSATDPAGYCSMKTLIVGAGVGAAVRWR